MLKSDITLPAIGSRVAIKYADTDAFTYLCWHGFHTESGEIGGTIIMRRDLHGGAWQRDIEEPPPPRFPIEILS
jgi:hypothetical protein